MDTSTATGSTVTQYQKVHLWTSGRLTSTPVNGEEFALVSILFVDDVKSFDYSIAATGWNWLERSHQLLLPNVCVLLPPSRCGHV